MSLLIRQSIVGTCHNCDEMAVTCLFIVKLFDNVLETFVQLECYRLSKFQKDCSADCTFGGQGTFLLVFPACSLFKLSHFAAAEEEMFPSLPAQCSHPAGGGRWGGFKQCDRAHLSIKITEDRAFNVCWEAHSLPCLLVFASTGTG